MDRSIKKGVFLVLRQTLYTVQATVFVGGNVGRPMVQYAEDVSKESVVDVRGTVVVTPSPVSGCTQKEVELKIEEVKNTAKCRSWTLMGLCEYRCWCRRQIDRTWPRSKNVSPKIEHRPVASCFTIHLVGSCGEVPSAL